MSDIVKVCNVSNEIEAKMIVDLLKLDGIEAFSKDISSGEYLQIATGASFYGKDIYVAEENREKAEKLIKENQQSFEEDEDDFQDVPFYKNKVIIVRIFIAVILLFGAVSLVLNFIN